jgi:PAS domain S-box-containing protein
MKQFPSQNENAYSAVSSDYEVPDAAESQYDDLARLAALICGAPTAFVSLVDDNGKWLRSRVGTKITEMPRENVFCAHTVLNPEELFIVEDAAKDSRFRDNFWVAGEPRIRFYAGVPLVSPEGKTLGSLCVIDHEPRTLSNEQLNDLKLIARQVVSQLELRKSLKINVELAERLNQVVMQASDGIHLYDFDGRITAANSRFCEITGRSETELLRLRVQDLLAPGELEKLPIRFAALRAGQYLISERLIMRPDGSVVPVEISGRMLDENTIQGIARDITERKLAEELLRQSERRYRDLSEKSLGLICTHDFQGMLLSINPAAAEALGYKPEEMLGKQMTDLLSPQARHVFGAYLEKIRNEREASGLMNVLTKDGRERIWKYNNVIYEENGSPPFVLGHAQDITELKKTEYELRALFEAMRDVILVLDENGRHLKIAPGNPALLYRPLNEILGKTLDEVFPADQAKFFQGFITTALETNQPQKFEYVLPIEGKNVWFAANATPMTSNTVLIVARDITERKQMEDELRATRDAALESVRLKSAFLTNVSHEIRTPMNGVLGMIELLLDTPLDRVQRDYAETIRQSGDALLTVINDILDLAKIESGKLRFEAVDFDVRETIENVVEMLAERALRKNIEIASLIDKSVPQNLRGDPGRLRQVLTNLVGNAVKFTKSGGVRVEVKTEKETTRQLTLRFEVIDTGIGIDKKNLKNLFKPFMQIDDSTTRQYGGTGLGLVISKQIVEMMSGEITVSSQSEKGSCFSFTACFERPLVSENGDITAPPVSARLAQKRILIADANEIVRQNLEDYSRIWDLTPSVATSGEEALQKLRQAAIDGQPFDFAVIDMNLPDWDGFSLAGRVKTDKTLSITQIIVTTAYGQRGDAARAREIGIAGYLTKPVRGAQLLQCLAEISIPKTLTEASNINPGNNLITRHSLREARAEIEVGILQTEENPFRLLIVEDNQINRRVILNQLKKIGVEADVAVNGAEALKKIADNGYRLIFMDCQMPGLDGYQTTREIRRLEQLKRKSGEKFTPLTIIALTAHTLAGEREKCLAAGMDDFLTKPLKLGELAATLRFWNDKSAPDEIDLTGNLQRNSSSEDQIKKEETFSSALDSPLASAIVNNLNDTFSAEIIHIYFKETERQIEEIEQALKNNEGAGIARIAHAVRGNSLSVGALQIAAIAGSIEECVNKNDLKEVPVYLYKLGKKFSLLKKNWMKC